MATAISFYLDEHVPRAVAKGLRQRGVDVLIDDDLCILGVERRDWFISEDYFGIVI